MQLKPTDIVEVLLPMVSSEEGTQLLAALKLLTKVVKCFHPEQLRPYVDTLVPALIKVCSRASGGIA